MNPLRWVAALRPGGLKRVRRVLLGWRRGTCCTIGCPRDFAYVGYYAGVEREGNDTLLCRRCARDEAWPAAWLHLPNHESSLEEMGRRP
jgi:hypothetical protein